MTHNLQFIESIIAQKHLNLRGNNSDFVHQSKMCFYLPDEMKITHVFKESKSAEVYMVLCSNNELLTYF